MTYLYTQEDRLKQPHAYMYTAFGGAGFLQSYSEDREQRCMMLLNQASMPPAEDCWVSHAFTTLRNLIGTEQLEALPLSRLTATYQTVCEDEIPYQPGCLQIFSVEQYTDTSELLKCLLATLILDWDESDREFWVRRLVQRFEVSKKLFSGYQPGFRKGEGGFTNIRLYGLFALCLAISYERTGHLQYLSTLLKLNDLLLSLEPIDINNAFSPYGIVLAAMSEQHAVNQLALNGEVPFNVE